MTDTRIRRRRRPGYWYESRRRFFVRNYGRLYAAMADAAWLGGYAAYRLRAMAQRKETHDPAWVGWDVVRHGIGGGGGMGLWRQIREDWVAHGRDWTKPGFRAVAVHRFGNWRMKVRWKLLRWPLSVVYRRLYRHCRNVYGIELPYTVMLGRRVVIEHQGGIVIHGYCWIGDECIIRQGVTLGNRTLEKPLAAPQLGRRVNVGAGAKVLGAVVVGDGANIGANAVVLEDVAAGTTVVGIPAKPVGAIAQMGVEI